MENEGRHVVTVDVEDVIVAEIIQEVYWLDRPAHHLWVELFLLWGVRPRLVVDFSSVKQFCSSAAWKLWDIHQRCKQTGGRLVLCSLTPEVLAEGFEKTGLVRHLAIVDSREEAIDACRSLQVV